jgi:2-keto-4-pentenoate hydratase/2-oxohepta-3-ene-1,7-dioic acid hydratase in catechol pathway
MVHLARFRADGEERVGFADAGDLVEVAHSWIEVLGEALEAPSRIAAAATGARWPLADCELLPPLEATSRGVFCIGMNYQAHTAEVGSQLGAVPSGRPSIFLKLASSMLGPGKPLVLDPALSTEIDWEVELGVVLGRGGRRIPVERVGEHIAGYTIVVDTTARDLQREHVQWFIGKNAHQSSPIGPWVTTIDEIGFPPALGISLHVNGVEKQQARTDQMVWSIAQFIAITSESVELLPGDVFATGSPPGVGFTREPPEFLRSGDVLRADIERVGSLQHDVH